MVDTSGSVATYSIPLRIEDKLVLILKYLEELIDNSNSIQDFSLERTSMDEVFVQVGKKYEIANGAE